MILSDAEKDIYSVRVTIVRHEQVDSGSMRFHHPRYITLGQTVIFTDKPIEGDQGGALVFPRVNADEVLKNLHEHIVSEKEKPYDSIIIEELQ